MSLNLVIMNFSESKQSVEIWRRNEKETGRFIIANGAGITFGIIFGTEFGCNERGKTKKQRNESRRKRKYFIAQ